MDVPSLRDREVQLVSDFLRQLKVDHVPRGQMPLHLAQASYLNCPGLNPDRSLHPSPRYASWIENQTILHPILGNRQVIVDLIDTADEGAFRLKYGVTPPQLRELADAGLVRLTLRDTIDATTEDDVLRSNPLNDPDTPSGSVLQGIKEDAVFVGPIRRDIFLNAMHPTGDVHARFKHLREKICKDHEALCKLAASNPIILGNIAFRDGKAPHINAVAWRLVYYEAYVAWNPAERCPAIEEWLDGKPAEIDDVRLWQLAQAYQRLHLFHLMNTANLTGSWGGQYLINPQENANIGSIMLREQASEQVLDGAFREFELQFASAEQRLHLPEMYAFRFNTEDGVLAGESWRAFRAYLDGLHDEDTMGARETLRSTLHKETDAGRIGGAAEDYIRFAERAWTLNHDYIVRFAEHEQCEPTLRLAAGGLAVILAGDPEISEFTSLSLEAISIFAKVNGIDITQALCWLRGQRQSHRSVYASLEKLANAQAAVLRH